MNYIILFNYFYSFSVKSFPSILPNLLSPFLTFSHSYVLPLLLCPVLSVLCFLCSFLIHFPFSIFSSGNTMPCGIRCFHGSVRSWRSQPYGCCHSRCLWGGVLTPPLPDRTIGCGFPSASPPLIWVWVEVDFRPPPVSSSVPSTPPP